MNDTLTENKNSAQKDFSEKKYLQAAEKFDICSRVYADSGDSTMEAEMRNNRSVSLLLAGQPKEAYEAALGTDQVFASQGDAKRQAMALGNIAAALEDMQQYEQSFQAYEQADELLKTLNEKDLRSMLLKRKALVQTKLGRNLEAASTFNAAIETDPHPSVKGKMINRFYRLFFPKKGK